MIKSSWVRIVFMFMSLCTKTVQAVSAGGNNVCSYSCVDSYYISQTVEAECGLGGWSRCAKSQAAIEYRVSTCYRCCEGWTSEGSSSNCDIAICFSNAAGRCLNEGKCVRPDECDCPSGTQLPMCEDIDECSTNNGGCTDRCVNSVGSYTCECDPPKGLLADQKSCAFRCFDEPTGTCANGGVCLGNDVCDCPDGTTSPRCEDIDECQSAQNTCEYNCVNVAASFHCTCPKGYNLMDDLTTCVAVCYDLTPGTCLNSHKCVAPDVCTCSEGYDLPMCEDKDECLDTKSHACRQLCINEVGSYRCDCRGGYVLAMDQVSCDDVDECVGETVNGGCSEICENVPGTFNCLCNTGFQLMADKINCEDIDECRTDQHDCESKCENVPGSFTCTCAEGLGWSLLDHVCKPVCFDEEPGTCPNQGTCVSTGVCECQSGYGNHNCSDIDECATNNGGCKFNCVNEVGTFFCDCFEGYTLIVEDNTCEDLNECEFNSSLCELECVNLPGSYACSCEEGFGWDKVTMSCKPVCFGANPGDCLNGGTCRAPGECSCPEGYSLPQCEDINECGNPSVCGVTVTLCDTDECAGTASVCELGCHNLPGSYRCDCEQGYSWVAALKACKAVCGQEEPGVCPNGGICETPGVCSCADGYEGNDCTDIDECDRGVAGCSPETCENTDGSYLCRCDEGFLWNPIHASCLADCGGPASGGCANGGTCKSPGVCACAPGYSEPDCTDFDECTENHGCISGCVNVNGSYYCQGDQPGYGILPGQSTQKPVCFENSPGSCPNGGACVQPDLCNCPPGYSPPHCSDLDECVSGEAICSGNCINVPGTFYCSSVDGYGRIPGEAVDKPVCFGSFPGECPNGGDCASPGICTCTQGYQTPQCTDKNECLQNEGGCDTECMNIPGSYFCHCWKGYGKQPGDVDCKPICRDSLPGTCPSGGTCISPSVCQCTPGYSPPHCTDINECVENNGDCELRCVNEAGAYSCECRPGFGWDRDQYTCRPVCFGLAPGTCFNEGVCTAPNTCSCPPEFQTEDCADVNECSQVDNGCELGCVNQLGGYYCLSDKEGYGKLPGGNVSVPVCFGHSLGKCGNGGTCSEPGVCSCPAGYEGGDCVDVDECESVSCEGSCMNKPGSYYCQGDPGYGKGPDDEIFKPLCGDNMPGECDNGGSCVHPGTCVCLPGFRLPLCADINECEGPNNGGCGADMCENTPGSYRCVCAEGYGWDPASQLCLPICYGLPPGTCNNKGTCRHTDICSCPKGYKEPDCSEIDECTEMLPDCAGTSCVNTVGSYYCSSPKLGYGRNAGDTEDKPLCYGQLPGVCQNGGTCVEPGTCSCPVGYDSTDCSDEDECTEDNGGCQLTCTNTLGSYTCDCGTNYIWHDVFHACVAVCYGEEPGKCANNGTCMRPWICICKPGFQLPACSDIDECAVDNGGCVDKTCYNELGSYHCNCESGHGWHAEDKKCKPLCFGLPPGQCHNGGECTSPDVCSCVEGFTTPECTDIDECEEDNGNCNVECVNIPGAYYCKTASGHGTLPGKDDEIPLCFMLPPGNCPNDGTCISPESCECKHGYVPPICDDYNECTNSDICELDCHNTDGSYFCDCHLGYTWDATHLQCKPSCFDLPSGQCPNGGSCLRPGVCQCSTGFKIPDCSDVDECAAESSPCELGCHNIIGSYSCDCHHGFSWDAEAMACLPECFGQVGVCPNGGTCKSPGRCGCAPGYEEPQCTDIDECSADEPVCQEGVCSNLIGSYMCGCEQGYAWSDDKESCQPLCQYHAPGVCANGGSCVSPDICLCMDGYDSSDDCKDIDECSTDNGGCELKCVNLPGFYYCVCEEEGYGKSLTDTECKPLCFGERPGACPNHGDCTAPGACSCLAGYSTPGCDDVNECAVDNGGCSGDCHNINGSYYCACEQDYSWNADLQSCQPVCFGMKAGRCLNGGKCTQPDTCSCLPGYELPKCSDINECNTDTHGCSLGCVNMKGSYYCLSQNAGYGRLPGQDRERPLCQGQMPGACSNGGFCYAPNTCECSEGFEDRGGECVDVDECKAGDQCAGECVNLIGQYRCLCDSGYSWDTTGHMCLPVCDGHSAGSCQNGGRCDAPGVCACTQGFQEPDCSDIDECARSEGQVCDLGCRNGNGFFFCVGQKPGYGHLPGETIEKALCDQSQPPGKCQNGGTCVRPGTCQCPMGFSPPLCADVNECESNSAGCLGCKNLDGGYSCQCDPGYKWVAAHLACEALCYDFPVGTCANGGSCVEPYLCDCPVGYSRPRCHDDDECSRDKGGCDQFCENTEGSFVCSCSDGFSLAGDQKTCIDTDECEVENGGCVQKCTNKPGSFECGCFVGYQHGEHGNDCRDIDECLSDNGGCPEKCVNTAGSFYCACFEGRAVGAGGLCLPVCYDFPVGTCGPHGICSAPNQCSCSLGFELPLCTDIDECADGKGDCDHRCENTEGSFTCHCFRGYYLSDDDRSCTDIDECGRWPYPCDQHCNNTQGSFLCSCDEEFNLASDGRSCTKEDPCLFNNGGCPVSLRCVNSVSGVSCECLLGFSRSPQGFCEDFNECTVNNGNCAQICVNIIGGHYCACMNKFELVEDLRSCQWCEDWGSDLNCWSVCKDNGHTCSCPEGRYLHEDGLHCVATCPCENGGYCKTLFPDYICDCEGTGFRGSTCSNPAVDIPSHIPLRVSSPPRQIPVIAWPTNSVTLLSQVVPSHLTITPKNVTLMAPVAEEYLFLSTDTPGIYPLTFSLTGPDAAFLPQPVLSTVFAGDIFVRHRLYDYELPLGCFRLDITQVVKVKTDTARYDLTFLSTSPWYQVKGMERMFFSHGAVVIQVRGHPALPLFLKGLEVVKEARKLMLGPVSSFRKPFPGWEAGETTHPRCTELNLQPDDLNTLEERHSLYNSLLLSFASRLPPWISVSSTEGALSYLGMFYPTLIPGYLTHQISACTGLPVREEGLYYMLRFTDPLQLWIYGQIVDLPRAAHNQEYCILLSQPGEKLDMFAVTFPESSRTALKQLQILRAFKHGTNIDISLKGLALSLTGTLPRIAMSQASLWNGARMFNVSVSSDPSVWMSMDVIIGAMNSSLSLNSSAQVYLDSGDLNQILAQVLGQYFDTLFLLEDNLRMVLNVTLLGTEHKLEMTSPGKLASMLSTGMRGASTRHTCGADSNPEGIFLKVLAKGTLLEKPLAVGNLTFSDTSPAYFTARLLRDNITKSADDYPPVLESLFVIMQVCEKTLQSLKSELLPYLDPGHHDLQTLVNDMEEAVVGIRAKSEAVYLKNTSVELLDFLTLSAEVIDRVSTARSLNQRLKQQLFLTFQPHDMSHLEGNVSLLTQFCAELMSVVFHQSTSEFGKVSEWAIKSAFEITVLGKVLRIDGEFWYNEAGLLDTCEKIDVLHSLHHPPVGLMTGVVLSTDRSDHSSPWLDSIWYRLDIQDGSSVSLVFSHTSQFVMELEATLLSLGTFRGTKLLINHNGLSLETTGLLWDSFPVSLAGFALTEQQLPGASWSVSLTGKFVSSEEFSFDGQLERAVRGTFSDLTRSLSTRLQETTYNLNRAKAAQQQTLDKLERVEQELSELESLSLVEFSLPAEASVEDLLHYLGKISDYNSVCSCSPCSSVCLGGSQIDVCERELRYPCLLWDDCAHQTVDLSCTLQNVACFGVLKSVLSRRNVSEETVLIGRLQDLIEDTGVQIMVEEENKFRKARAQIKQKLLTYHLDECKKDVDNLERHLKTIREKNIHILYLQDFIKRNGVRGVVKVTNCGFETTTGKDDFHKIDVQCVINPLFIGQRLMTFSLDLGKAQSSVWRVAQGLVSYMLDTVQNTLTNLNSNSAANQYLFHSIKEHLFTETATIHVDADEDIWENRCKLSEDVLGFLDTSVSVLSQVTLSISQTNTFTQKLASFPNSLPLQMSWVNNTAAWIVYDLGKSELSKALSGVKPKNNKVVKKIKELYNFAKQKTTAAIEFVQDVPVVPVWQSFMDARTHSNFTLCSGFADCIKQSLFQLTEFVRTADPRTTTQALQTIWSVSKSFSAILTSNSYSMMKLHEAVKRLQSQMQNLRNQQVFCAATFSTRDFDSIVVVEYGSQVELSCPVKVDLVSSVVWLRDSSRLVAVSRDLVLALANVSVTDSGSYTCTVHSYSGFQTSPPIQLAVRHPLAFTSHLPLEYQAVVGDTVRVDCGSEGTPPRETFWKTNSGTDPEPGEELLLQDVSTEATGIYRCEVRNNHGSEIIVSSEMFLAVWKVQPICPTVRYRFSYISGPKIIQNEKMAEHRTAGTMQEEFSRALSAIFHDKSNTFFLYDVAVFEHTWLGEFSVRSISCQSGGFGDRQSCEARYREELSKLHQFLTVFQAVRGSVFLFEANHMYYYLNSAYYDVISNEAICPEGQKKAGDFICVLTETGLMDLPDGSGIPYAIGRPANLTLAVDHIRWDPPANGGDFVKGYRVLVIDVRLAMRVIVNDTTTELRYPLPFDLTSGNYHISVTTFSSQHTGQSAALSTEIPQSDNRTALYAGVFTGLGLLAGFLVTIFILWRSVTRKSRMVNPSPSSSTADLVGSRMSWNNIQQVAADSWRKCDRGQRHIYQSD